MWSFTIRSKLVEVSSLSQAVSLAVRLQELTLALRRDSIGPELSLAFSVKIAQNFLFIG